MKKALIVGLNKYPGCELACCSNDAVAMKELIESNGDGSPNFDVVAITDSCTKKNLKIHIEKLFADDADIALLYFSGHGADCDGKQLTNPIVRIRLLFWTVALQLRWGSPYCLIIILCWEKE